MIGINLIKIKEEISIYQISYIFSLNFSSRIFLTSKNYLGSRMMEGLVIFVWLLFKSLPSRIK
jgi:hypothetical protein